MTVSRYLFSYLKNISLDKIYNEASLQFDLGLFLQEKGFKVEFEVNIESLPIYDPKVPYFKHEIDIVLYFEGNIDSIIELKAPMMKRYYQKTKQSKRGFTGCVQAWEKDIKFLDQVKSKSIKVFSVFLTDDTSYYVAKRNTKSNLNLFRQSKLMKITNDYNRSIIECKPDWVYANEDSKEYNFFVIEL